MTLETYAFSVFPLCFDEKFWSQLHSFSAIFYYTTLKWFISKTKATNPCLLASMSTFEASWGIHAMAFTALGSSGSKDLNLKFTGDIFCASVSPKRWHCQWLRCQRPSKVSLLLHLSQQGPLSMSPQCQNLSYSILSHRILALLTFYQL